MKMSSGRVRDHDALRIDNDAFDDNLCTRMPHRKFMRF